MSNKTTRSKRKPPPRGGSFPMWLLALPLALVVLVGGVVALLWWQGNQAPAGYQAAVTGQPSAKLSQTEFDYGDVKLGTTVTTQFDVQNVGDKELVFAGPPRVEVREGC